MWKLIWLRLTGQRLDFFSLQERREYIHYQGERSILVPIRFTAEFIQNLEDARLI